MLWGEQLQLNTHELEHTEFSSSEELLNRYAYTRWIKLPQIDLCSFTLRGVMGDEEVYKCPTLKRLIPRTYIVPWNRAEQRFDHTQAITGLTKIAGMQDEGVHQVLNIEEINTRCAHGERVSIEKANGKACVFWVKYWASEWVLGFSSKTSVDPQLCYKITAPLYGEVSWSMWVSTHLAELGVGEDFEPIAEFAKPVEAEQRPRNEIIEQIARYTFQRLARMSDLQVADLIQFLQDGATLCGELEEGGRHIVPTLKRVVYFVASRFTPVGITLDSPIEVSDLLHDLGLQTHGELAFKREPFQPLLAQPRSLQLSSSLIEGSVRYFLDAQGVVVSTMKIKDPHYMFYRKLRNSMGSSAKTPLGVLRKLIRGTRDSYYQRCLHEAGIPTDFSQVMLRSAAGFLYWFTQQEDLGDKFKLAGFMPHQIGLGALMMRWREAIGEPHLGDYTHVVAFPEYYQIPEDWVQRASGGRRVAMLALHGAQGSGKSTLSIALCQAFNRSLNLESLDLSVTSQTREDAQQVNPLALPAEQDPLQRKRDYLQWLDDAVWPELRAWLTDHDLTPGDDLPATVTAPLAWHIVCTGKSSTRFVKLLGALYQSYVASLTLVYQARGHEGALSSELLAQSSPIVIVNARCNQNHQATQRWETWLGETSYAGLATARLNAPISLLNARIQSRGRKGDDRLMDEVLPLTHAQVARCTGIDLELDATRPTSDLVDECLPLLYLAVDRVHEQWRFNLNG